jgi:hypothetical protein
MELKATSEEWSEIARGLWEVAMWSLAMGVVALVGVIFGMVIMAQLFLDHGGWR